MRADLHTMEQIDLYLQGKMAGEELRQFENILSSNPDLKSMVIDQQLLIQTVNRKALLAEINAVAGIGGAPWYANPFVAATGIALVVGGVIATVYFMSDTAETENIPVASQEMIENNPSENNENPADTEHTLYMGSDSLSESDNQPEQYIPNNNHSNNDRVEPEYFEAHTPALNNQAEQLSQHADDQADHIVSDLENDDSDASHFSKNRMASFPLGD